METINNVEKEIEVKIEQGREQLVNLRNLAYDKYCEAWNSMEHVKETTFDTLRAAWEQAWTSYSSVVHQLKEYGYTAVEKSTSEYDVAKQNLIDTTKELQTWIIEHGQKLRDDASDVQIETAQKLHQARKEAYERYIHSKDALKTIFLSSQNEAEEDLRNAQEQVRKTTINLDRYQKNATDTSSAEYQSQRAQLEEAKTQALKELEDAKAHSRSLSEKVSLWSEEVVKILSEQSEFLSQRVLQMRDQLFGVASETQEKIHDVTVSAEKVMSKTWEEIFNSLKDEAAFAFDKLKQVKDSVQDSIQSALQATGVIDSPTSTPPCDKSSRTDGPASKETNVALA